nr:Rhomboid-like protease 5 [Ipomoea batatas]GME11634.1 Rhomboid-like protease 5 [Ipomoea batatas]
MFTEGLDSNALKWVREGSGNNHKNEVHYTPMSTHRARIDTLTGLRNGGRSAGLPPSKFQSGHLSGVIPVSRVIHADSDDNGTASENDMCTDSEEEVYGGRYSVDSSPQDERLPARGAAQRYYNYAQRRVPQYGSESAFSDDVDVNSSRETIGRGIGHVAERAVRGTSRFPERSGAYTEEEESDSAASSEFSTTQVGTNSGTVLRSATYASEDYSSSVPSKSNRGSLTQKDMVAGSLGKVSFDEEIPSAPPICGSAGEIKQDNDEVPASGATCKSSAVDANGPSAGAHANISASIHKQENVTNLSGSPLRTTVGVENGGPSGSHPTRLPTFHVSALGPWHRIIAYDACVRLCLHAWARGCMEAPMFLENECALLREAFSLQQVLLQSEEDLMAKRSSERTETAIEGAAPKSKQLAGKMKVQVKRVKMVVDPPTGCSFSSLKAPNLKMDCVKQRLYNLRLSISSGWRALCKVRFAPQAPRNGSFSRQSLAYMQASTQYIKQVSGLLKIGVTSLRSSPSSYDSVQESYSCLLRLKSSREEDAVRMQPGSSETHIFFPDSLADDLIVEVYDSKGQHYGRVLAQGEKLRWWSLYHEPEHELVGKVQLFINYSTIIDENSNLKCGSVAETVAYDLVLEVAMKIQHFQQRKLLLHGPWKWLLSEFSSYYGVSDTYTRLRYLSYVMDVATPTADCLTLVYELLLPVMMKGNSRSTLSHQENRILGEIEDQLEQIFALVFENYKLLDESAPSGLMDIFRPATGVAPPALEPAVKLYSLLHDILSPEVQNKLYSHFQAAAKKRSRRHLTDTDEYVSGNNEATLMDAVTVSTAYQRMKSLCTNIRNEIFTDIEIHNQNILPSFIDLPNLSSAIYSAELCSRLRAFLIACPPTGPSPHVTALVIATSDFQRDLANWNIKPVKGGVDAKELFHLYIMLWIQDRRLALLESCKLDKVKWSGVRTQHSTTPFIDEMYDRLKETLNDYEVIISRWPEYSSFLESAVADIEKAILEALEKQYADVLSPLKENLGPKKFGLNKYVQKLAKRSVCHYVVPDDLGILLNSMKRMLDILRPKIEQQFKSWGSYIPEGGNTAPGERLSEVTVMLRSKFKNYLQAVVDKLAENMKAQGSTKLKKILHDTKDALTESDVRSKMQPLKDQLTSTINHLYTILGPTVFVALCRGYWDRMGQDVLSFLESRKENRAWYKNSRIAVSILDDTFASQMQQHLGHSLQEKDLEPPRSILEVRSMLCRDGSANKGPNYYY